MLCVIYLLKHMFILFDTIVIVVLALADMILSLRNLYYHAGVNLAFRYLKYGFLLKIKQNQP